MILRLTLLHVFVGVTSYDQTLPSIFNCTGEVVKSGDHSVVEIVEVVPANDLTREAALATFARTLQRYRSYKVIRHALVSHCIDVSRHATGGAGMHETYEQILANRREQLQLRPLSRYAELVAFGGAALFRWTDATNQVTRQYLTPRARSLDITDGDVRFEFVHLTLGKLPRAYSAMTSAEPHLIKLFFRVPRPLGEHRLLRLAKTIQDLIGLKQVNIYVRTDYYFTPMGGFPSLFRFRMADPPTKQEYLAAYAASCTTSRGELLCSVAPGVLRK